MTAATALDALSHAIEGYWSKNHQVAVNICGSGTGAVMSVNKFAGVLACACESVKTAQLCRIVNGANCLCLGEDIVSEELGCEIADAFLNAKFQDNPYADPKIRGLLERSP